MQRSVTYIPENELRQSRKAAGLTQAQLAEKVGFHQCMVCAVEKGTRVPSLKLAAAFEHVFGIPASAWVASLFSVPITVASVANDVASVAEPVADVAPSVAETLDDDLAAQLREALG